MSANADALVIGAGPAGASIAIRLATAGWHVILIEQQPYPRQKVCGECITAGGWSLLDELGVGSELGHAAGPDLRKVGWMSENRTLVAQMPACLEGRHRFGRALGRDILDAVLLERARSLGVTVLQPAKMLSVSGPVGHFDCQFEFRSPHVPAARQVRARGTVRAAVVVDAHGSWEREISWSCDGREMKSPLKRSVADLLAFKATFRNASLLSGFLPVVAFDGGYGGIVEADHGRTTLACCIRRDALDKCRRDTPGEAAGEAIEAHLRRCFRGIAESLRDAQRDGCWLSVGAIRPGVRVDNPEPILRVGNAAGETHPLVGEGIGMALQSAALLARQLGRAPTKTQQWKHFDGMKQAYAAEWRRQFASRLRIARIYAHIAMNPALRPAAKAILTRLPKALTLAAQIAGKARPVPHRQPLDEEPA